MNQKELAYFTKVLEDMYEGIYFVDNYKKITFWNKGAEEITGFKAEDIMGYYCYDNILNHVTKDGEQLCLGGCPLHATIMDGNKREAVVYLHHKDGHRVKVGVRTIPIEEDGHIIGAIEAFSKMNVNTNHMGELVHHIDSENSIEHIRTLALHDQLTLLPNRRYIESKLDSKMGEYENSGIPFGVLFMDIDLFRNVNNQYGHATGDKVLQSMAKSFLNATTDLDSVGRWGGEEFIAIISVSDENKLEAVAERMRMLAENSVLRLEDKTQIQVTVSIGGSMVRPGDTKEILVKRADILMYESKSNGRNQVTIDKDQNSLLSSGRG